MAIKFIPVNRITAKYVFSQSSVTMDVIQNFQAEDLHRKRCWEGVYSRVQ